MLLHCTKDNCSIMSLKNLMNFNLLNMANLFASSKACRKNLIIKTEQSINFSKVIFLRPLHLKKCSHLTYNEALSIYFQLYQKRLYSWRTVSCVWYWKYNEITEDFRLKINALLTFNFILVYKGPLLKKLFRLEKKYLEAGRGIQKHQRWVSLRKR